MAITVSATVILPALILPVNVAVVAPKLSAEILLLAKILLTTMLPLAEISPGAVSELSAPNNQPSSPALLIFTLPAEFSKVKSTVLAVSLSGMSKPADPTPPSGLKLNVFSVAPATKLICAVLISKLPPVKSPVAMILPADKLPVVSMLILLLLVNTASPATVSVFPAVMPRPTPPKNSVLPATHILLNQFVLLPKL